MRKWIPGRAAPPEHLPILGDGLVEQSLALVRFAGGLVQPGRIRRHGRASRIVCR